MNSGHIKERSPTIPPCTKASATPKEPTMTHKAIYGPIPPFPEVTKSNYCKM